jgi:hypothetical protein
MLLTPDQIKAMQQGAPQSLYGGSASGGGNLNDLTAPYQAPVSAAPSNPIGDFAKSLVSAPATMLARPFQAVAELGGTALGDKNIDQQVNDFSQKYGGGLIAPTDQNFGDVGKDVGRGIQTAALGLGPVAGGAAFMGGNAITEGKDPLHVALDTALGAAGGKVLGLLGKPVFNAAGNVMGKVTPQFLQDLASKGTQAIQDFAAAHDILPEAVSGAINKGADVLNNAAEAPFNAVGDAIKVPAQAVSDVTGSVLQAASRSNVGTNLPSSISRLNDLSKGAGEVAPSEGLGKPSLAADSTKDPLSAYNDFLTQEAKFKGDAKADTALGVVGTNVGRAYDKVIGMRRDVGKAMSDEIGKNADLPVDVSHTFPQFEQNLHDSGLTYNADAKQFMASRTSKVTSQDRSMLNDYAAKLNKLGVNPTAAELDAFLSRVPSELDVYKQSNNITKATNGERLIKGNLNSLAGEMQKAPELAGYNDAKSKYADLSQFLNEGSSFLGKKTASGDYAKDASLAKSSIQSVLNGGKKDWLIKLEEHTGYPAIDHSMLALQAMKDSGNFRGSSLLDLLSPESKKIPLSKEGIIGRAVDLGVAKGKQAALGSPIEQTRRIIRAEMQKGALDSTK